MRMCYLKIIATNQVSIHKFKNLKNYTIVNPAEIVVVQDSILNMYIYWLKCKGDVLPKDMEEGI
jgi:hypothetical protein